MCRRCSSTGRRRGGPSHHRRRSERLPTTAGLGGVTVQASVGGATVDCVMVNNGVTASRAITAVAAAFGVGQRWAVDHPVLRVAEPLPGGIDRILAARPNDVGQPISDSIYGIGP
jgi:hypothetical protein